MITIRLYCDDSIWLFINVTCTVPELGAGLEVLVDSPTQLADSGPNSANSISLAAPLVRLPSGLHNKLTESVSDEESSPSISCVIVVFCLLHGKPVKLKYTRE